MIYVLIVGFLMALADSVPGVSGGTIAFVMGVYDEFITSLNSILHGTKTERMTALKFIIKLGIGWLIGMILAVSILAEVFTTGIYQVSSLFLGFVLASIPLIIIEEKKAILGKWKNLVFTLIGIAFVAGLASLHLSQYINEVGMSFWMVVYVFIAGMLAISAMVLPGISGSSLLMTFGLYVPVITAVKEFLHMDFSNIWLLFAFGFGVIAGIFIALKGIKKVLDNYHSVAIYTILGMMIGSLYAIVVGPTTLKMPQAPMSFSSFHIVFFLVGCLFVGGLALVKKLVVKTNEKKDN